MSTTIVSAIARFQSLVPDPDIPGEDVIRSAHRWFKILPDPVGDYAWIFLQCYRSNVTKEPSV